MPKLISHPGVTLVRRGTRWRARWKDPSSGKYVWLTLDPVLSNESARLKWAKDKSKALGAERMALASGAVVVAVEWPLLSEVINVYFEAREERLRANTLKAYRTASNALLAWAKSANIVRADELTKAKLLVFRQTLVDQRKQVQVSDGARKQFKETTKPRSAHSVNRELRALATILEWLRSNERLALSHDDIRDGLKREKVGDRELPAPIARERIRELTELCRKHEPALYPYLLVLLLTGMRAEECRALRWSQVDLVNKHITLSPADTKTKRGRRVDLAPSPALAEILEALPRNGERVFNLAGHNATDARQRLIRRLGWSWTFQECRETCASYLCSAPWYGPFKSAKRLGHSTIVADRLYAGSLDIDPAARDLETAMGIADRI